MAGVVASVPDDKEWKVDRSPLVPAPDEKKASSDTEAADSEPMARARDPPARPALGGGVTMISRRSVDPLDTVTGEPSPMMAPASLRPKPNPGRASLARRRADSNSSPRSVTDVVRRSELLRLGAITRGSPGKTMVWLEIAASSAARERKDGWRDKDPALDPERD